MRSISKFFIACILLVPTAGLADPNVDDSTSTAGISPDGWRLDVKLAISDGQETHLSKGYGVGGLIGHETMYGRVGITMGVAVELSHYSSNTFMGAARDVRETNYFALAMVRVAYHGETWRPYASFGVGMDYVSGSDSMTGDTTDKMIAFSLSAGVAYQLTDTLAIGPFLQYQPCFEPALNQFWDLGLAATFGL